jgi:hypothetical protein
MTIVVTQLGMDANPGDLDLLEIIEEAYERCGSEARVGYDFRTARRSLNLLFADWANRGINLWTLDSGSIPLVAGTAQYAFPSDTVDVLDCVVRTNDGVVGLQNDRPITRISNSQYTIIPNKLNPGQPLQAVITRAPTGPSITMYPVPNLGTYKLVYWRMRRMASLSGGTDASDIPFRMLPPLVSGLAYYLSFKTPGGMERMQALKSVYDEDWTRAAEEDREKVSIRAVPRIARVV